MAGAFVKVQRRHFRILFRLLVYASAEECAEIGRITRGQGGQSDRIIAILHACAARENALKGSPTYGGRQKGDE